MQPYNKSIKKTFKKNITDLQLIK